MTEDWPEKTPYGLPKIADFTPHEVCRTFKAVCVNIKLNTCVKAPDEFRAPWSRDFTERDPGRTIHDPPFQGAAGSYMIITDVDPLYEQSKTSHEPRQLFSGCDEGCLKCVQGTGKALHPVQLPSMCFATEQGSVFAMLYNHNSTQYRPASTEENCVDSLVDHYSELEKANETRQLITGLVIGGCALIFAIITAMIVCRFRKRRARMEEELVRALRDGHAQFNVGQGPLLGQAQIEQNFPIKTITPVAEEAPPTCVVCLSAILSDQPARELQCAHAFHADCILSWWMHRPRRVIQCPLCQRQQIVADHVECGGTPAISCGSVSPVVGTVGPQSSPEAVTPQVIGADAADPLPRGTAI